MATASKKICALALAALAGTIGSTAKAQPADLPRLPPLPPPPSEEPSVSSTSPTTAEAPPARDPLPAPQPGSSDRRRLDDADSDDAAAPPSPPDPWETRPIMVEGHLGMGTPVGVLGVALDYSPLPALGLNLGVGLGISGGEYAFTARGRLFRLGHRTHVALFVGAGVSANPYDQPSALGSFPVDGGGGESSSEMAHYHWNMAYWANLEAGVEIRLRSSISLRPYMGVSRLLNPDGAATLVDVYSGKAPTQPVVPWSGYVGFALGYAVAGW